MAVETSRIREGTGPLIEALPFDNAEYERRLAGVRQGMLARGLDALLCFSPENIYYLTAHDTPGYYFYQASIVTHDKGPINVLRRIEATNTLGRGWTRLAVPYGDREDPVGITVGVLEELGLAKKTIGAEAEAWFVTPKQYSQLEAAVGHVGGRLIDASGTVEELRAIKSPAEIAYIRAASRISELGTRTAIDASREGTDENAVAAAAIAEMTRAGGEYGGLPAIVNSGPRTSLCHAVPGGRILERGDVIEYALPGSVKRYAGVLIRIATVGTPDPEIVRRQAAVHDAVDRVIAAIRPGALSGDVHAISRSVMEKHGYGHLHGHRTGYSIGVAYPPDWGEGQIVSIWADDPTPLREGMTFQLALGLFELGKYLVNMGETVLVTKDGCESLTQFSREHFVV